MNASEEFSAAKRDQNEVLEGLKQENSLYHDVFSRAYANTEKLIKGKRMSHAAAVKAKCLDCTSFQRMEIRYCQAYGCPLWPVRPYRIKQGDKEESRFGPRSGTRNNLGVVQLISTNT